MIGGGNAERLGELPPNCRLGHNEDAFLGGFRLWIEGVDQSGPGSEADEHAVLDERRPRLGSQLLLPLDIHAAPSGSRAYCP